MVKRGKAGLAGRSRLVEDLLIVDGITRAGKFLFCNLLEAVEGVDRLQYCSILEHLPYLQRLGLIEPETAKAVISCQVDNSVYDRAIGRSLNFRASDKSSVFSSPRFGHYLRRCFEAEEGDAAVEKIMSGNVLFPFVLHEVLPNMQVYFEAYPKVKWIEMVRNPVDLVYSWFKRGWGRRWGNDPKDFSVPIEGKKGPVPWFASEWSREYEAMGEMDRIIKSIDWLSEKGSGAYAGLSPGQKRRVVFVPYEKLLTAPEREMEKVAVFLGRKLLPELETVKEREGLPGSDPELKREEKLAAIKKQASPEFFSVLGKMDRDYRKKHGSGSGLV